MNYRIGSSLSIIFFLLSIVVATVPFAASGQFDQVSRSLRSAGEKTTADSDGITPDDLNGNRRRGQRNSGAAAKSRDAQNPTQNTPEEIAKPGSSQQMPIPTLIPAPTSPAKPSPQEAQDAASPTPAAPVQILLTPKAPKAQANAPAANHLDFQASSGLDHPRAHYPQNRVIRYVIQAHWNGRPGEVEVDVPQTLDLTGLRQEGPPVRKVQQGEDAKVAMIWNYLLKPISEGRASIGPIIVTATTKTGQSLPPSHLPERDLVVSQGKMGWLAWAGIALGAGLAVLVLIWILLILFSLARKKQYQEAMHDSLPSVDERLQSEVDTLQVSLLRGNVAGYYQKISLLTRQLLKGRGFLDQVDLPSEEIVAKLRTSGTDTAFVESVESILRHSDTVLRGAEKPDQAAQETVARDLKNLIHARVYSPKLKEKLTEPSTKA